MKFSFDGILIFCLDDFLATFTFRGLECSLGGNETCQSPLQKSKFKYLDHVKGLTHTIPSVLKRQLTTIHSLAQSVMSVFDEAFQGQGTHVRNLT